MLCFHHETLCTREREGVSNREGEKVGGRNRKIWIEKQGDGESDGNRKEERKMSDATCGARSWHLALILILCTSFASLSSPSLSSLHISLFPLIALFILVLSAVFKTVKLFNKGV